MYIQNVTHIHSQVDIALCTEPCETTKNMQDTLDVPVVLTPTHPHTNNHQQASTYSLSSILNPLCPSNKSPSLSISCAVPPNVPFPTPLAHKMVIIPVCSEPIHESDCASTMLQVEHTKNLDDYYSSSTGGSDWRPHTVSSILPATKNVSSASQKTAKKRKLSNDHHLMHLYKVPAALLSTSENNGGNWRRVPLSLTPKSCRHGRTEYFSLITELSLTA